MEIEAIKKIIQENLKGFPTRIRKIRKAELYYENKNDILRKRNPLAEKLKAKDPDNPLRSADNRVSHSWHQLLVNQKAAYTTSVPPSFDVDDKDLNHKITVLLGDRYPKVAKDLCVNASNAGVAWLHVWRDIDNDFFRYGIVDSKQIIPVYGKTLDNVLEGVLRVYDDYNDQGDVITIYEYWTDEVCQAFVTDKKKGLDDLQEYPMFMSEVLNQQIPTNEYRHEWGAVPFIPFRNNPLEQSDLATIKQLIDVYDKVYSGFVNDTDDIQEIIFVLTNYGGEDKQEFLQDLKNYKMVKVDDDGNGAKGGVETLAIDIPVEARDRLLNITREGIFTHGQGVDPQRNIGQNNSGVALKYMYSLLELKASMLETEFKLGFAELIRFILRYLSADPDCKIKQTWTRSAINNDLEQADVVAKLANVTSKENIAKSNPLVEDWEVELKNLAQEAQESFNAEDEYENPEAEKEIEEEEDE